MVSVHVHTATDNLPEKLGEYLLQRQQEALETAPDATFKVAISGGSLINVLHTALVADSSVASRVQWSRWEIYFVDERIVPLDHADSNYGAFKTAVLDTIDPAVAGMPQVFPIDASLVAQGPSAYKQVASAYQDLLPKVLDCLLLGCGPDGHTCSLFPGETHRYLIEERNERVLWCHDSPKPPSDRITITVPVLEDARNIAFVAEGASKQPIMHEIFDIKNTQLPTALINKLFDTKVTWFVNDEAFAKVQTKTF